MCPTCLDYLTRRKEDADDPTLGNWPARGWPTPRDLEEARGRYPEPMFPDDAALREAAPQPGEQDEVLRASMIWTMERETPAGAGREGDGDV